MGALGSSSSCGRPRKDFQAVRISSLEGLRSKLQYTAAKCPLETGTRRHCAVKAGAKFIVSPGLNPEVVKWCQAHEVPVIPGIVTPTEMEQAIGLGLTMVKFFPAEPAGGLKYIRAIAAPYTMMKFMPTGGINPQNVREYLAYDRIAACGGSWMVKNMMIENNEFDRIEELVKEAVEIVKESRT